MAARRAPIFGPEEWASVGGVAWSHWDRWYSAVCLAEADGDWPKLAEVLANRSGRVHLGSDAEAKLSHLDDLARRLDAAGLGPADLAGELDKAEMAKARRKVLDQGLSGRDLTPAMRDTPRRRLRERALRGSWAAFPADPSAAYAALGAGVEEAGHVGKGGTFELVRELKAAIAAAADDAAGDPARLLAARRAALTAVQEVAHRADDSYGVIGELGEAAWRDYAGTPWRDLLAPGVSCTQCPASAEPPATQPTSHAGRNTASSTSSAPRKPLAPPPTGLARRPRARAGPRRPRATARQPAGQRRCGRRPDGGT